MDRLSATSPGVFISFEGVEGAGKSTQLKKISDHLIGHGHDVLMTKEPGGTQLGQVLRQQLLDPNQDIRGEFTEILLFTADRLEHVEQVIKPALAGGQIVLCDRYVDSTFAYQAGGRQVREDVVRMLTGMAPILPQLTLLFDCPVEEGLERVKGRGKMDRFEHEALAFHNRVRDAYLKMAQENPNRIQIISTQNRSVEAIFAEVLAKFSAVMIG